MTIHTQPENNAMVVTVNGRLDTVTQAAFDDKIRELIDGGNHRLVVDLEQLAYISSAGLRGMLTMAQLLKERDGRVCLAKAQQKDQKKG